MGEPDSKLGPIVYPERKPYVYAGCYKDNAKRDMKTRKGRVNLAAPIDTCFKMCAKDSFAYIGVQDQNECFCDHNFSTPESDINNNPHTRVANEKCPTGKGGPWRDCIKEQMH